jgi:hypothetical protein
MFPTGEKLCAPGIVVMTGAVIAVAGTGVTMSICTGCEVMNPPGIAMAGTTQTKGQQVWGCIELASVAFGFKKWC